MSGDRESPRGAGGPPLPSRPAAEGAGLGSLAAPPPEESGPGRPLRLRRAARRPRARRGAARAALAASRQQRSSLRRRRNIPDPDQSAAPGSRAWRKPGGRSPGAAAEAPGRPGGRGAPAEGRRRWGANGAGRRAGAGNGGAEPARSRCPAIPDWAKTRVRGFPPGAGAAPRRPAARLPNLPPSCRRGLTRVEGSPGDVGVQVGLVRHSQRHGQREEEKRPEIQ